MDILRKLLIGQKITLAETLHDYAQICFGLSIGLSIYSTSRLIPSTLHFVDLVGQTVSAIETTKLNICIILSKGDKIIIDMIKSANSESSEIMELFQVGEYPVIWNQPPPAEPVV